MNRQKAARQAGMIVRGQKQGGRSKQGVVDRQECMQAKKELTHRKTGGCMYHNCIFNWILINSCGFKYTVVCVYISGQLAANHHQELPMLEVQVTFSP
jgi:hypothetical protein